MSIGSIVGVVAGKIGELLVQEAKLLYGVEDQVRSLQEELMMMDSFLGDMEARDEKGGDQRSQTTIKQIRKLVYDAEDVIENYLLEAKPSTNKAEDLLKRYACFCTSLLRTHQVGSEIETIKEKINETMERWRKYIGENVVIRAGPNRGSRARRITYPHANEEHVVGLQEDINKLVWLLTADATKIQVLSIVGMGGSGKTTLARKLYNHESVKGHFDCIAWLSVSKEWAAQQILVELLRDASGETMGKDEAWSIQILVEKVHRYLEGKRYLIVLDDVWTKQALEEIFPALPNDGRRIIITTRIREVVDFPDLKCSIHEPRRLTREESWELFRKIALIHREQSNDSMDSNDVETLGKEMLEKCEGLPLAVIALAGILSKKETFEEWERVKKAISSRIMEDGRGTHLYGPVNEMLTLSYNDLQRDLKPCFLYLAMFPEDYEIPTGRLIKMWIAEGFISSNMLKEGETLEDVALDYLEELIDSCVVQIASKNYRGKVKSIRVHDLVRDLCIRKAKEQDFLEIFTSQSSNPDARGTELRRTAIYFLVKYIDLNQFTEGKLPTQSSHLRSLLYQGDYWNLKLSLKNIHENFRLLRVLFLKGIQTPDGTLPSGIGSLIHLRYLHLQSTNIQRLPDSIGSLRNLLTLYYMDVRDREEVLIPDVLWKIEGLRHLYLPHWSLMTVVCRWKLHTLKQLKTLRGIVGGSWVLEELPHLSPTVQKLHISGISSEEQLEAAFRCPSIMSDGLHSLQLEWNVDPRRGKVVMLENLQPISHCQHLRKLELRGRIQDILSSCNQIAKSIMKLVLGDTGFEEEVALAALGKLPNLVYLGLYKGSYVGANWTVMAGQFTQLKELHLAVLANLEDWRIEAGAMSQLRKLVIYNCEKLWWLPEGLQFITTLQELKLWKMGDEFNQRVKEGEDGGGGEDAYIIQHVPLVKILS